MLARCYHTPPQGVDTTFGRRGRKPRRSETWVCSYLVVLTACLLLCRLQSSTLSCSAVPLGQVSGARVAEGVIYATRFILPPLMRSDPVADAMFETLQACSEHRPPFGLPLLKPLCAIAYPVIKCFR